MKKIFAFFKKAFKYISYIITILFIGSLIFSRCNNPKTASAEGETVAAESGDIDLSQYPSANLFNLSRELGTLSGGGANSIRQFNTNEYYVGLHNSNYYYPNFISSYNVSLSGVQLVLAPSRNYYGIGFPFIRSADVYSFSCLSSSDTSSVTVAFYTVDGEYLTQYSPINQNFTINFDYYENAYYFVIIFSSSTHGSSVTFSNIMLNAGSTAYPYQPNLNDIYNQGYDKGYDVGYNAGEESGNGYQDGYNAGYAAASDDLNLGILKNATISGTLTYDNGENITIENEKPNFSYNGFNLDNIRRKYENYNGDNDNLLSSANITVNFDIPFSYAKFPVYFIGRSLVGRLGYFVGTDEKQYTIEIPYESDKNIGDARIIKIKDDVLYNSDLLIKQLNIVYESAYDELFGANYVIFSDGYTNGYNNGYNNGYTEGESAGTTAGYENGYQQGQAAGENIGYDKAVNEGIAGAGIFSIVISIIRLFFSLVVNLLSLELGPGITVGLFVIGIPATFMIIDMSIGVVKKITGKGD